MLRSLSDVNRALEEGRVHKQRFFKNPGVSGDGRWIDWSFASGQPAYDARLGDALAFTPYIAQGNDAIYFPGIPDGMERAILELDVVATPSSTGQLRVEFQAYDLLGVYALIDGDNTEPQDMDNTLTLPRFQDGSGVQAILVNHIAPATSLANMNVVYTNSEGVQKATTWRANLNGTGTVSYTVSGAGTSGPLCCSLADADRGVRQIDQVTFVTPPGGLWAIYLVKPLGYFAARGGTAGVATWATAERNFYIMDGGRLPPVKDGAWLGFFYMTNGSARTVALHGNVTFIWG